MATRSANINGEEYVPVVLHVTSRDQHGRPRECRTLYDEESIEVVEGMEFIVVFAPKKLVTKTGN